MADIDKIKMVYNTLNKTLKKKEIADFIFKIGLHSDKKEIYELLLTL